MSTLWRDRAVFRVQSLLNGSLQGVDLEMTPGLGLMTLAANMNHRNAWRTPILSIGQ